MLFFSLFMFSMSGFVDLWWIWKELNQTVIINQELMQAEVLLTEKGFAVVWFCEEFCYFFLNQSWLPNWVKIVTVFPRNELFDNLKTSRKDECSDLVRGHSKITQCILWDFLIISPALVPYKIRKFCIETLDILT